MLNIHNNNTDADLAAGNYIITIRHYGRTLGERWSSYWRCLWLALTEFPPEQSAFIVRCEEVMDLTIEDRPCRSQCEKPKPTKRRTTKKIRAAKP